MAARRAARAAARAAARPAGAPERLGRRVLGPASRADEDVTELDSIPAGRIDQEGPYGITVFRSAAFRRRLLALGYRTWQPRQCDIAVARTTTLPHRRGSVARPEAWRQAGRRSGRRCRPGRRRARAG